LSKVELTEGEQALLKDNESALLELLNSGKGQYAASIFHFETGEELNYLYEVEFYAASVIKIPIMASVFAEAAEGKLSLFDKIRVRFEDLVTGAGSLQNLTPENEWSIYDLMVLMIIESDNTATNLLIDVVGVENVQSYMKEWGFRKSQFHHKLQIMPAKKVSGSNLITAGEMTDFMKKIALGKVVSWNACRRMVEILKQQKVNHLLPSLLPMIEKPIGAIPSWEMAHKTGYIPGLEHDVALCYFPGHTFAVSVLCKNVPNREEPKRIISEIGSLLYQKSKITNY
jgi:beta-lactamase class A